MMKRNLFRKKAGWLLAVFTIINLVIVYFRDAFQYQPYTSYAALYQPGTAAYSEKWTQVPKNIPKEELAEASHILHTHTDIARKTTTQEKVLAIGSFLRQNFAAQYGTPAQNTLGLSSMALYHTLLQSKETKLWCGQFGSMFLLFCWSQNIQCRYIELFQPGDHHVVNESFLPELNQWVMTDVTFNTLLAQDHEGQLLNARAFYEKVNSNEEIYRWSQDSNGLMRNRLNKNLPFIQRYFRKDCPYYYYNHTDLKQAYRPSEKVKRFFLPVSWYEIYSTNQQSNLPFWVKIGCIIAWLCCLGLFITRHFRKS